MLALLQDTQPEECTSVADSVVEAMLAADIRALGVSYLCDRCEQSRSPHMSHDVADARECIRHHASWVGKELRRDTQRVDRGCDPTPEDTVRQLRFLEGRAKLELKRVEHLETELRTAATTDQAKLYLLCHALRNTYLFLVHRSTGMQHLLQTADAPPHPQSDSPR